MAKQGKGGATFGNPVWLPRLPRDSGMNFFLKALDLRRFGFLIMSNIDVLFTVKALGAPHSSVFVSVADFI